MFKALFSDEILAKLKKLKKKDRLMLERIKKKVKEILEHPYSYKPLKGPLKGKRRVHIGSFVLIFEN